MEAARAASRLAVSILFGDQIKSTALIIGLTFSAFLCTLQASVYAGFVGRMTVWIRERPVADLWVTEAATLYTDDLKPMADSALLRIRGTPGVAWAVPMVRAYLPGTLRDGTRVQVRLVGLDDASLAGAPPVVHTGRFADVRQDRTVAVSLGHVRRYLSDQSIGSGRAATAPGLGDRLHINDVECRIVADVEQADEFFWDPIAYTSMSNALRIIPPQRRTMTTVLVKVMEGADAAAVARGIEARTGLAARTPEEFARQAERFLVHRSGIGTNFGTIIALGTIVGLLVSGLLMYMITAECLPQYAALAVMGIGRRGMLLMVTTQVVLVSMLGLGLGLGLAAALAEPLRSANLAYELTWWVPVGTLVTTMLCCVAGATAALTRLWRMDLAMVFRAR